MPIVGLRHAKNEALPGRTDNSYHIQSGSLKDIDDTTRFTKFMTSQVDITAFAV